LTRRCVIPSARFSSTPTAIDSNNFGDVKLSTEAKEGTKFPYFFFFSILLIFIHFFISALKAPRDVDEADVVIVGGGPSGMCAAIRIKQLCAQARQYGVLISLFRPPCVSSALPDAPVCFVAEPDALRVVVLEKAAEVGNHILSGAVVDPRVSDRAAARLEGAERAASRARHARRLLLAHREARAAAAGRAVAEQPRQLHRLAGEVVRWLGQQAEALGVEVFPGFAASELLRDAKSGAVVGVATGDSGISKTGDVKATFARGMELRARATLLAEGCRGSLTLQAEKAFDLGARACSRRRTASASRRCGACVPRCTSRAPSCTPTGWPGALGDYSRLVHVPLGGQPGADRLRRRPRLHQSAPQSVPRVSEVQAPPAHFVGARGRRVRRVRRARAQRGRLPVDSDDALSGRRHRRLRRRLPRPAQDQGLAQRHEDWHAGGRGDRRAPARRRGGRPREAGRSSTTTAPRSRIRRCGAS
jgi:hypothetical protein